jgi:hypothetical protein
MIGSLTTADPATYVKIVALSVLGAIAAVWFVIGAHVAAPERMGSGSQIERKHPARPVTLSSHDFGSIRTQ